MWLFLHLRIAKAKVAWYGRGHSGDKTKKEEISMKKNADKDLLKNAKLSVIITATCHYTALLGFITTKLWNIYIYMYTYIHIAHIYILPIYKYCPLFYYIFFDRQAKLSSYWLIDVAQPFCIGLLMQWPQFFLHLSSFHRFLPHRVREFPAASSCCHWPTA